MRAQHLAPILLLPFVLGCGATGSAIDPAPAHPVATPLRSPSTPAPLCRFDGPAHVGPLRTERGIPAALVRNRPGRGELIRTDSGLQLQLEISMDGWHLRGWVDPGDDEAIHVRSAIWIAAGIGIPSGGAVSVLDAREGEILVAPAAQTDRIRFLAPTTRWIACSDGLLERSSTIDRPADHSELGIESRSRVTLDVVAPTSVSETIDGAPFAEIVPGRHLVFDILDETPTHRRVAFGFRSGYVVGWISRSALRASLGDGGMSVLGALGPPMPRCSSTTRMALYAEHDGAREEIGWVDPGTPFYGHAGATDVMSRVRPLSGHLAPANEVEWVAVVTGGVHCE